MKRAMIILGFVLLMISLRAQHFQSRSEEYTGFHSIQNVLSVKSEEAIFTFHRVTAAHDESYIFACRYDLNGKIEWQKKIFVNEESRWLSRAILAGKDILLIGDYNFGGSAPQGVGMYVLKVGSDGIAKSCKLYRFSDFNCHNISDVKALSNGDIVFSGTTGYYHGDIFYTYGEINKSGELLIARTFPILGLDDPVIAVDDDDQKILWDSDNRITIDKSNRVLEVTNNYWTGSFKPEKIQFIGNDQFLMLGSGKVYLWNRGPNSFTPLLSDYADDMKYDALNGHVAVFSRQAVSVVDLSGKKVYSFENPSYTYEPSSGEFLCGGKMLLSTYRSLPGSVQSLVIDPAYPGNCAKTHATNIPSNIHINFTDAGGSAYNYTDRSITTTDIPVRTADWGGLTDNLCNSDSCHFADLPIDTTICEGHTLRFALEAPKSTCGSQTQFVWEDGSADLQRAITTAGNYTLTAKDGECSQISTIRVSVRDVADCNSAIYMPAAFTPDGDGINEEFLPIINKVSSYHLDIFDRWGKQLYAASTADHGWNGKYLGEDCPSGVYLYTLKYRSSLDPGAEKIESGKLQLLR